MKFKKLLLLSGFSLVIFALLLSKPTRVEAAITFRAASTANSGSACSPTNAVINVPAGVQNGDVMIANIYSGTSGTWTTPTGWTLIDNLNDATNGLNVYTYYRVVSSEPASYTWTNSYGSGLCWSAGVVAYSGVNNSTPIDVHTIAGQATSTTHATTALTTTVANDMVLLFYNGYSSGCLGDTWTTPTGTSSRASTNNASCRSTAMFDIAQASIGTTGSFTSTVSETATAGVVTIALRTQPLAPTMSNTSGTNGTIDVGPMNPTTVWSDNYDAYSKPWTNPSYANTADGQYATSVLDGSLYGRYTSLLWGYGFGFNIPVSASILGIKAEAKSSVSSGTDSWYTFLSTCANQTSGGSYGCTNSNGRYISINTTMQYGSAGSSSDLWGTTFTPTDINSATFGMRVQESNIVGSGSYTYSIDHYRITVTIQSVSGISATGATLVGYVNNDGGSTITSRGVCVGTGANPSIGGNCLTATGTTGGYTVTFNNLSPSTLYHFRSYATNAFGTTYSTDDTFSTTAGVATITSPTSASVTVSSATLGGNVTSIGGSSLTARGICYAVTSTNNNPQLVGSGVTCTPQGATTTGVFTVNISNLQPNTAYSFNAYATNSYGTAYTLGTFSTLNPAPTSVTTVSNDAPQSYYVNLKGSANPNGYPTNGHFRVFTSAPASCAATSDTGGIRYPEGSGNFPDIDLGSGSSPVNFNYQIPFNASTWLYPNTTYYYCAYAVNTVSSVNYTTGATSGGTSGVISFTTPDGPSGPCDAPSAGNMTIPAGAVCNFTGTIGGVDSGTGTRNTAQLTIPAGARLSITAGQKVAFGSVSLGRGAILAVARGGTLAAGGVFVHDKDRDNYLDDTIQYVGSTPSAATEFIRRNTISSVFNYSWKIASASATYDCNNNSAYAYRTLPNMVRDADNDGYKTATAAGPQCVGASAVFNGRTYYNDGSGPN